MMDVNAQLQEHERKLKTRINQEVKVHQYRVR